MSILAWLDTILFVLPCWGCLMQTNEKLQYQFCISPSHLTRLLPFVACLPDSPLRYILEPSLQCCLPVLLDSLTSLHTWAIACQRTLPPPIGSACEVQPLGMVPGEQEHSPQPQLYLTHIPLSSIGRFSSEGLWSAKWLRSIAQSLFQKPCNTPKYWRKH